MYNVITTCCMYVVYREPNSTTCIHVYVITTCIEGNLLHVHVYVITNCAACM